MNRSTFLRRLAGLAGIGVVPAVAFIPEDKAEPPRAATEIPNVTMTMILANEPYAKFYCSEDDELVIHNERTGNWIKV